MTNKTYIFTSVKDIADQLSEEQIDRFLIDFGMWLRMVKTGKSNSPQFDGLTSTLTDIIRTFAKLTGEKLPEGKTLIDTSKFGWTDDGKHYPKTLTINSKDTRVEFTVPEPKEEKK